MAKQASTLWKYLRRSLAADPGRFPGGSAWIEPLSLLAVERDRVAAQQQAQRDVTSRRPTMRAAARPHRRGYPKITWSGDVARRTGCSDRLPVQAGSACRIKALQACESKGKNNGFVLAAGAALTGPCRPVPGPRSAARQAPLRRTATPAHAGAFRRRLDRRQGGRRRPA